MVIILLRLSELPMAHEECFIFMMQMFNSLVFTYIYDIAVEPVQCVTCILMFINGVLIYIHEFVDDGI